MSLRTGKVHVTPLTVADLMESRGESLELELLTPDVPLTGVIDNADASSPGLALAGFTRRFVADRPQVLGETEMTYLAELGPDELEERLRRLFAFAMPVIFVTKGLDVPDVVIRLATESWVPVIRTRMTTKEFFYRLKPYLEASLAPTVHLHGSFADVFGVGLLFVGKSGVGKSECVLDLVERGHRLVADDLVQATRRGTDLLMGRGHPLQRHHMEIRGVGIIDIRQLFGVRAIRQQKRIEVIVQLEHWDEARSFTRTGLDPEWTEVLGVRLPRVTVPLNPGKNITVISEVVAMTHLLRYAGVDSAKEFDMHLRAYLEQDFE